MREETASELGQRIARDLREDLGARLLGQLHASRDEAATGNARLLLAELRVMLDALDPRHFCLGDCLDQWHAALMEQCSSACVQWHLQQPAPLPAVCLTPVQRTHTLRVLAEFVGNAHRHARPKKVELAVSLCRNRLQLRCRHDGRSVLPGQWRPGRGLHNQQLRAADLGGNIGWRAVEPDMIELQLDFPVGDTAAEQAQP